MDKLAQVFTSLCLRAQAWRFGSRLLWAIYLFTSLYGCTTHIPESCSRNDIRLNWANPVALEHTVSVLSSAEFEGRRTQSPGAAKSRDFINQQFKDLGLTPWGERFEIPFQYHTLFTREAGVNMVAISPAQNPTNEWRIIVAHYDHLGISGGKIYHGADDNASGVAAMLAIAQYWQEQRKLQTGDASITLPNINLMFVATDAEEPGLYGSIALVEQLKTRMPEANVQLMLNLDMVSHPGRPYSIYLEGSRNFKQFSAFKPQLNAHNHLCIKLSHPRPVGRSIQNTDWLRASDHYPFHQAKIPWLYFGVPTHPQYHTPQDTVDTVDFIFLAAVTESAFELMRLNGYFLKN